jgi:hypothetical protein
MIAERLRTVGFYGQRYNFAGVTNLSRRVDGYSRDKTYSYS